MFTCVGIVSFAILWLLYEADWMRLRLLIGPNITSCPWSAPMPCDGCGANHGTVLHAHAIKVFGGDWHEYHVCAVCLDSIEHRPNKRFVDAAQRAEPNWQAHLNGISAPSFCSPALSKWIKYVSGPRFAKKYKNWPQTFVLFVDGKKRVDWHTDSWTAEAPKNFAKAYKSRKAKASK